MFNKLKQWFINLCLEWTIPCPDCKEKFCTCDKQVCEKCEEYISNCFCGVGR